jgi:hypothetical protein
MVIANALYNNFVPSVLEINSLGIGMSSHSNVDNLDLSSDEYLVVGERHNYSGDTMNSKYNLIVNSDGIMVNASRNMTHTNAGIYCTNDIVTEGKIIAKGLELQGVTIANEVTSTVLNNLIQAINAKDQLFYTGFSGNPINNIGEFYTRENIYTTSYLTIGALTDTFSNTHALNIVETANNTINNIQICIQNDINNDNEPAKMRLGLIGNSPYSPAIISTTENMPLEFHVSIKSDDVNALYNDNNGFPNYLNTSNIPSMTIDKRRNVGIGATETDLVRYTEYNKNLAWQITNSVKEEYSKLKVNGSAFIENIITYDYYTQCNLHLNDIYVRTAGLSVNANQIKDGNFNKGIFIFNSNLYIGNKTDKYTLEVNSQLNVSGDLKVANNTELYNVSINGDADFNSDVQFANNVNIESDLYVSNCLHIINGDIFYGDKRLNITELHPIIINNNLLENSNIASSNIIYFANNNTLNISGSNLAIPGRAGVGILSSDSYENQFTINKRIGNTFELLLQDYSKNVADSSKVYIGHIASVQQSTQSNIVKQDSSFVIFTQRTVSDHNIYFFAGKDINRINGINNITPTLAIMQNDMIGINTNKPLKTLDVIGDILCTDLYIRKNNIIYKTAQFYYNNDTIYLYDQKIKKICLNFINTANTNVDLKGLNVYGGINSTHGYFDNNIKIETLKYHELSSVNINKNISIGWKGEKTSVPLQVRNLAITDYNNSIIRIYRGQRGGGFNNDALYSGIDICEYDSILPTHDKNNFKWFMYKNHIDSYNNLEFQRIGPLQFGYTDNSINPTNFCMSMYYNKNKTYHIDINNPKINYSYKPSVAMSIYGDLEVYGNINLIDNSNLGLNYKINGITVSSNIGKSIIDNSILNQTYNDYVMSKDDISINGQKIVILPTKTTAIGYVDNWFLQYVQRIQNDTNHKTPLVVYQKNTNSAICKFGATDSDMPCAASIELGTFYTKKNYTGENKNMAEFKVLGYNNTTILELNSYSTYNQTLRPFITFYNNGTRNYINIGNYAVYDHITGVPIANNVSLHINDNSTYLLQLTNHTKTPIINMHRINGNQNNYWLLNGPTDNNNFSINYGYSDISKYSPDTNSINQILTLTNDGKLGLNNTYPNDTLDISSLYNVASVKLTNNYMNSDLYNVESSITIINSNLKLIIEQPSISYVSSNVIYNTGVEYTIDTSNLPSKDNNNNTLLNYFLIDTDINVSNVKTATTYHEVDALLYHSNLSINDTNILLNNITCNIVTNNITESLNYTKTINILPVLRTYNDFNIFVPNIYISSNSLYSLSNIYVISSNYTLKYNYNNYYNIPNILLPQNNYITTSSYYNITSNVVNNIIRNTNIYVYNTINFYIPLTANLLYNKSKIIIDNDVQLVVGYSNFITTSNVIWYNDIDSYTLGVATHRKKLINFNSLIKVPNTIAGPVIHNLSEPVINNCNILLTSTIDFLNNTPLGLSNGLDFSSYISRRIINTSNYEDTFEIYDIPQKVIISIEDAYKVYNFMDYIKTIHLNIKCIKYLPHISLQNNINFDDNTSYPIDKVHKIYSYEGKLDFYIDAYGNSTKLLSINENGDTNIKGSISANDIVIKGHIYDANGNDLVQQINGDNYKITSKNYEITASNIVLNPQGNSGILINAQERNYTNNIFQINSGNKDNDANFITLYTYTNGSYIHFTSHMQVTYNSYKDMMYRLGMYDDKFGIWYYNINDVATLPGGYVDGRPSSMVNYLSAMTIKLNETTNLFDFNFNGSLNLNQSSSSYLLISNLKIQNNIIKQIANNSNIVSFSNSSNIEVVTITTSNVGINIPVPNLDYSLHVGGAARIEGDIRASGNFITTSDKRYKKDITRIENALEKINKLTGVTYNNISSSKRQSGLVAQEVNEVFPEVVNEDSAGYLSLAYGNMMGLIIEGMKELKNDIKEIKEHLGIL